MLRLILFFSLLCCDLGLASAQEESPLIAHAQISPYELAPEQSAELKIDLELPDGYKAYVDQFKVEIIEPEAFQISAPKLQPTKELFDKFSKKKRVIVEGKSTLLATLEAPKVLNGSTVHAQLTYQACTQTYCLFPKKINLEIPVKLKIEAQNFSFLQLNLDEVFQKGLFLTFVFVFIMGFLTSLTPCVFPMIPITLAVLGREAHARSRLQNILVSHIYVLGIATTFSSLGIFAASTGALFGSMMSSPWVLGFICIVFFAMALSMFGLFEIEAPRFLRDGFLSHFHGHGYSGAFISGLIAGIVASPCVGPVLVGILTFVAKSQNLWLGFWLLFVYAFGMGQLFLLLGISSQFTKLLPKSGGWMETVKKAFALMMLAAFYYYLRLLVPHTVFMTSLLLAFVILPIHFKAFAKSTKAFQRGFWLALFVLGLFFSYRFATELMTPKAPMYDEKNPVSAKIAWLVYSEELMKQAALNSKPVIIDFHAEWCAACHELDQYTFTDAQVEAEAKNFVMMKFDATQESEELDKLKKKYGIVGLPTVVFHNAKGEWLKTVTLTEFEDASKFLARMKKASP